MGPFIEMWRPIDEDPRYEVSSFGRVRSWASRGGKGKPHRRKSPIVLKLCTVRRGAKAAYIGKTVYGKRRMLAVHRLVLRAFVGPCPRGMEGCHNDGDPSNNILRNLRWDTRKGNHADKYRHGTMPQGERHHNSVTTEADVIEIRRRAGLGESTRRIARDFPYMTESNVQYIVERKTWSWVRPRHKERPRRRWRTPDEVREIRRLAQSMTRDKIADRFCVSPQTVEDIVTHRTWKHVR